MKTDRKKNKDIFSTYLLDLKKNSSLRRIAHDMVIFNLNVFFYETNEQNSFDRTRFLKVVQEFLKHSLNSH